MGSVRGQCGLIHMLTHVLSRQQPFPGGEVTPGEPQPGLAWPLCTFLVFNFLHLPPQPLPSSHSHSRSQVSVSADTHLPSVAAHRRGLDS